MRDDEMRENADISMLFELSTQKKKKKKKKKEKKRKKGEKRTGKKRATLYLGKADKFT